MTSCDPSITTATIVRLRDGGATTLDDHLAVEEPLEIRLGYNDPRKGRVHRSISITMRTPGDDEALALGFLFSESIITSVDAVSAIDASTANVLRIELHDSARFDPLRLERHFYTTSSCGVCGKASLEALSLAGFDALPDADFQVAASVLYALGARLRSKQQLFTRTGGNHATALFTPQGDILEVSEDVGRHNAMDKLIGRQLRSGRLPLSGHGIMLSGRASFELLQKALAAGCALVAAVGAPSSLAVELAREYNITLVGFLSSAGCNIYHGAARIRH